MTAHRIERIGDCGDRQRLADKLRIEHWDSEREWDMKDRIAELEAAIRYGVDLLKSGLVDDAISEMERRLTGADK